MPISISRYNHCHCGFRGNSAENWFDIRTEKKSSQRQSIIHLKISVFFRQSATNPVKPAPCLKLFVNQHAHEQYMYEY